MPARPLGPWEAYDLYLKGEYAFNKRTPQGLRQAIHYASRATEKDPQNARAFAGLSDAYALIGGFSQRPQMEFEAKSRAAAVLALELDPNLAEPHTALALIVQNHDWDWQTAEREHRRAIELSPNYATAHHVILYCARQYDAAIEKFRSVREMGPGFLRAQDHRPLLRKLCTQRRWPTWTPRGPIPTNMCIGRQAHISMAEPSSALRHNVHSDISFN